MCGIVGYIGKGPVVPTVLEALSRLEYRGYDSAGIAAVRNGGIDVRKRPVMLKEFIAELAARPLEDSVAIGHTRWATHGEPSALNAHPHTDCTGQLALVHNGIVENYEEIKARLLTQKHRFRSATDTEVIVHLIEEHAKRLPIAEAFR